MLNTMAYFPVLCAMVCTFFFFRQTGPSRIYTLSLHDALPISMVIFVWGASVDFAMATPPAETLKDRKSTRLNSSHTVISYAVFCLKKKSATSGCLVRHASGHLAVDRSLSTRPVDCIANETTQA